MAELTFRSAGVSTREIDLSGPTVTGPQGIPAGVIGTSVGGPAFVPVTFANFSEFVSVFGETDGEKFGPLAVNEWLKNARALTYLRVLGVGDGKKRNATSGVVTNAGFFVGNDQVQTNGQLGANTYANASDSASIKGRTYFLGCFMSESNGSTIFSSAGIQKASVRATAVDAIDTTSVGSDTKFTILVPTAAGGESDADATIIFLDADQTTNPVEGANEIGIGINGDSDAEVAARIINAINGATDANVDFASSGVGQAGVQGVRAEQGTTSTKITLTIGAIGEKGNLTNAITTTVTGDHDIVDVRSFTGGRGGAVPILRGVLLAPSGVILHLSGNNSTTTKPDDTATAVSANGNIAGQKGTLTGSVDLASQEFVMLLNGFKGTAAKKTHITASFDMTATNYFGKVFNKDPLKIESEGHLLYGQYDIYPTLAAVTGAG